MPRLVVAAGGGWRVNQRQDCLGWFGLSLVMQVLICHGFSSWFCLSVISNAVFPLCHNGNEMSRVEKKIVPRLQLLVLS